MAWYLHICGLLKLEVKEINDIKIILILEWTHEISRWEIKIRSTKAKCNKSLSGRKQEAESLDESRRNEQYFGTREELYQTAHSMSVSTVTLICSRSAYFKGFLNFAYGRAKWNEWDRGETEKQRQTQRRNVDKWDESRKMASLETKFVVSAV
jgi:hypothetical protein